MLTGASYGARLVEPHHTELGAPPTQVSIPSPTAAAAAAAAGYEASNPHSHAKNVPTPPGAGEAKPSSDSLHRSKHLVLEQASPGPTSQLPGQPTARLPTAEQDCAPPLQYPPQPS